MKYVQVENYPNEQIFFLTKTVMQPKKIRKLPEPVPTHAFKKVREKACI